MKKKDMKNNEIKIIWQRRKHIKRTTRKCFTKPNQFNKKSKICKNCPSFKQCKTKNDKLHLNIINPSQHYENT